MMSNSDQSPPTESAGTSTEASEGNMTEVPRARLTRLKINRFRNVKPGTDLRFDDGINVLLGRNGTGKTTLLDLVCALSRGNLSAYQYETFDLEFEVRWGGHCFTILAQNTVSLVSMLAGLDAHRHSPSWMFRVDLHGPSGRLAVVEASPRATTVHLTEGGSEEHIAMERSLFDIMFYVVPFLQVARRESNIFTALIGGLLPVHCNCLRLDEGLDVFRSIVDGTSLPNIGSPLSTGLSSRGSGTAIESYAPQELVTHISNQGPSVHEATEIAVDQSQFGVLDTIAHAINVKGIRCSLMLLDRKQDADSGTTVSRFGKPSFWITTHRGTTFTHDKLSYGEKRLLAFLYHAAANPQILIADELVNGLHYEWIQACLDAIQGQAFLTSQNPLLLDHLPFTSAAEAQRRFILCDRDEHGDWIWRNMDQDAADAFYRAYDVGVQHVSGILRTKGLW